MSLYPLVLWGPVQLGSSAGILGAVCPANAKQIIKRAVFTNMDAVQRLLTVYVVRAGGSTTNATCLINQQPIPAASSGDSATYIAPELANFTLNAGDAIYALADAANKVNANASGWQM